MTLKWPFHGRSLLILLLCFALWSRIPPHTQAAAEAKSTSDTEIKENATLQSDPNVNPIPDSVTAASTDIQLELIEGYDNLDGIVGVDMDIKFFASEFVVDSYTVSGNLPPGLRLSREINEFGVGSIQGTPTQDGLYLVNVTGWEEPNANGNASTPLSLLFDIISLGPNILEHPTNTIVDWGQPASLHVLVEDVESASFKWFKDLVEIEGETGPSLNYEHASYRLNGTYRVEAIGPEGKSYSEDAFLFVRATRYQRFLENTYEAPFRPELAADLDTDRDRFKNLVEYALGSDLTDPLSRPTFQFEVIKAQGQNTARLTHSLLPNLSHTTVQVEVSEDLSPASWMPLNIPTEEMENVRIYSWIAPGQQFIRIKIVE